MKIENLLEIELLLLQNNWGWLDLTPGKICCIFSLFEWFIILSELLPQ